MRGDNIQSLQGRRELRRLQRSQQQGRIFILCVVGLVLLALVIELGRASLKMRQTGHFVATLETLTPAQVKGELDGFYRSLDDHNPLVRGAALTAFVAATGQTREGGSLEWREWWRANREKWEYGVTNTLPEERLVNPHPYRRAFPPE